MRNSYFPSGNYELEVSSNSFFFFFYSKTSTYSRTEQAVNKLHRLYTFSSKSYALQVEHALRVQEINPHLTAQSNSATTCLHHVGTLCISAGLQRFLDSVYSPDPASAVLNNFIDAVYLCSCPTPATRNLPVLENFKLFTKPIWKKEKEKERGSSLLFLFTIMVMYPKRHQRKG